MRGWSVFGCGVMQRGLRRDRAGSLEMTRWVTLGYLPLLPLSRCPDHIDRGVSAPRALANSASERRSGGPIQRGPPRCLLKPRRGQ